MNYRDRMRKFENSLFVGLLSLTTALVLLPLFLILLYLIKKGISGLNLEFFTKLPNPPGVPGGGLGHAILGSLYTLGLSCLIAVPWGLLLGIYLAEFGQKGKFPQLVRSCIDLLTGIPSIIVGLLGYFFIVIPFKSFSALAGALALAIIILPLMAKTTEETLITVSPSLRETGLALGLSRFQVLFRIILPQEFSALITGVILGMSRAAGETAPLLFTAFGNVDYSFALLAPLATLPVQIFQYATSPFQDWHEQAFAGALVLVILVLGLNLLAKTLGPKTAGKRH